MYGFTVIQGILYQTRDETISFTTYFVTTQPEKRYHSEAKALRLQPARQLAGWEPERKV